MFEENLRASFVFQMFNDNPGKERLPLDIDTRDSLKESTVQWIGGEKSNQGVVIQAIKNERRDDSKHTMMIITFVSTRMCVYARTRTFQIEIWSNKR